MRMKTWNCYFSTTLMLMILIFPSILLGEEKPSGQFSLTAANKYIWRGYELSRNSLVFQPFLSVSYRGFNTSLWGNMDLKPYSQRAGENYSSEWNETDFTFSYTKALNPANITAGYIYYSLSPLRRDLPDRPDAQELFISISLNSWLNPTLTVYKEVAHYKNWYFLGAITHEFALNKTFSLRLSGSVSYLLSTDESFYPEFDENALPTTKKFKNFHDGTVSISLPVKLTSLISVIPNLTYVFPLSQEAKDEMKGFALKGSQAPSGRESSYLIGSLTFSFSF